MKGKETIMRNFNYKPLIEYVSYLNRKYINPDKAGADKESMQKFKEAGQSARKTFTEIAKSFESKLEDFKMQKVSSWMNQAQIGRPYFWVFFKRPDELRDESGFALRVFGEGKNTGISLEVSFLERGIGKNTIHQQNKVLEIPIKEPLYYFSQIDGENYRMNGNEENRQKLIKDVTDRKVRKVLVKYDVNNIQSFKNLDELTDEFLKGFKLLYPYYEMTKIR